MSFARDATGVTAVLQGRRTYRYGAHAAQRPTTYLISRRTESHNSSTSDNDASASTYVDGPGVLYCIITAIVELRRT
jgi:hypothetical protein